MWVAVYSIFNEADFIEKSIRNVIDEMDKVIVVEGCWKNGESVTGSLRSTDGTIEILENLKKEYRDKIEIIHANEANEQRQRDRYLEHLTDGDYVCWIDGDELVFPKQLKEAKEYCEYKFKKSEAEMIFSHYVNVFPNGAVRDTHIRGAFFKFRTDLRYLDNERIKTNPGEVYLFTDYGTGNLYNKSMPTLPWEMYIIFHYKYCKNVDSLVERRMMYDLIWNGMKDEEFEKRKEKLTKEYSEKVLSSIDPASVYIQEIPL